MDILKTMRNKIGLSQQDMANLLGVTRPLYSLVETGKRTLPSDAALRFAALIPVLSQELPPPTLPNQVPDSLRNETEQLLNKAKQDLYIAENPLKSCTEALQRHQHLQYFLEQIGHLTELQLTNRGQQLVNQLAQDQPHKQVDLLLGQLLLSQAQVEYCQRQVAAYSNMLQV